MEAKDTNMNSSVGEATQLLPAHTPPSSFQTVPDPSGITKQNATETLQIEYANGDQYKGSVDQVSKAPSGNGSYEIGVSRETIEGEFVEGTVHGNGTLVKANGDTFAGRFTQGNLENGMFSYSQTDLGKHISPQANSKGRAIRYRGSFKDNLPNGVGTLDFANGDVYEGSFAMGKAHGTGRYATASGEVIAGLFENGRPVKGMRLSASGHKFLGEFHATLGGAVFHGFGRLTFSNGDSYEGTFENGHFVGEGIYRFADGLEIHCATWMNDSPSGVTEVILPDGSTFVGSFFGDKRHLVDGRGVMKFSDESWFDCRNFRRMEVLPTDKDGGAFYYQKRQETRKWVSLESCPKQDQSSSSKLWLVTAGKRTLGLGFSTISRTSESQTNHAKLFLAVHQYVHVAMSLLGLPKDQLAWVTCEDCPEGERHRVSTTIAAIKAVCIGEANQGFCLLGGAGEGISENCNISIREAALERAVQLGKSKCLVVEVGKLSDDGRLLSCSYSSSHPQQARVSSLKNEKDVLDVSLTEELLQPAALLEPDLIVLLITTGFANASSLAFLVKEMVRIQSRLVVVWVGGNDLAVAESGAGCAAIAERLVAVQ